MDGNQNIPALDRFYKQTDSVAFAVFSEKPNEVQENILTVTTEKFSRYLIHLGQLAKDNEKVPDILEIKKTLVEKGFQTDPAGNLVVEINPLEVMPKGTYYKSVRRWCKLLFGMTVEFKVQEWNGYENVEAVQTLFTGFVRPGEIGRANGRTLYLSLNNWAIPFFLFYGINEMYYGKVQREIALGLKGARNKRLYKMACSMYGKHGNRVEMSLEDLARMLNLDDRIRHRSESVQKEDVYVRKASAHSKIHKLRDMMDETCRVIRESGSDVWFEYELVTRNPTGKRGRNAYDTIVFIVHSRGLLSPKKAPVDEEDKAKLRDLFTQFATFDFLSYMNVYDSVDRIVEAGAVKKVLQKHAYYKKKFIENDYNREDAKDYIRKQYLYDFNIIVKMLREDFNVLLNTKPQSKKRK